MTDRNFYKWKDFKDVIDACHYNNNEPVIREGTEEIVRIPYWDQVKTIDKTLIMTSSVTNGFSYYDNE